MSSVVHFFSWYHFDEENFWTGLLLEMKLGLSTWILRRNSCQCYGDVSLLQATQRKPIKLCQQEKSSLQCFGVLRTSYSLILWNMVQPSFRSLLWHFEKTKKSDPKQVMWSSDTWLCMTTLPLAPFEEKLNFWSSSSGMFLIILHTAWTWLLAIFTYPQIWSSSLHLSCSTMAKRFKMPRQLPTFTSSKFLHRGYFNNCSKNMCLNLFEDYIIVFRCNKIFVSSLV